MHTSVQPAVVPLTAAEFADATPQLAALLVDVVADGSSLGFRAPLDSARAEEWWQAQLPVVVEGVRRVWAARDGAGRIVGTVQLQQESLPNGRHRGEVQKLMVHPEARGRGLARALLDAAEQTAAELGRTLLLLNTESDTAERLYYAAGWTAFGTVPDYATDPHGRLRDAVFFYKRLGTAHAA